MPFVLSEFLDASLGGYFRLPRRQHFVPEGANIVAQEVSVIVAWATNVDVHVAHPAHVRLYHGQA